MRNKTVVTVVCIYLHRCVFKRQRASESHSVVVVCVCFQQRNVYLGLVISGMAFRWSCTMAPPDKDGRLTNE